MKFPGGEEKEGNPGPYRARIVVREQGSGGGYFAGGLPVPVTLIKIHKKIIQYFFPRRV